MVKNWEIINLSDMKKNLIDVWVFIILTVVM